MLIPLLDKYFIDKKMLSEDNAAKFRRLYQEKRKAGSYITFGELLIDNKVISERDLALYYRETADVKTIEITETDMDLNALKMISPEFAAKHGVVPVKLTSSYVLVAMKDPSDLMTIQLVRECFHKTIKVCFAYPSSINLFISQRYGMNQAKNAIKEMTDSDLKISDDETETIKIDENTEGNLQATVKYVNLIIKRALEENASDIHIEPGETETVTRIRVDGLLREIQRSPVKLHHSIVARIKVMGNMDVTEHRVPLDGRSSITCNGENTDLRISSLPTVFGEKIVIRLLKKSSETVNKNTIGLSEKDTLKYDFLMKNHSGVILIAGPTGCGKSTTMLTMLKILNTADVNIITLEDPVEYNVPGVSQVQINEKTGMTFAKGLKAALRQDPDIICVGEIRDAETAEIAMRAAITGHLVISTLHTNSAASSIERLIDMGVEPYLISSALLGIISQRLVRKLCPECKQIASPDTCDFSGFKYDKELKNIYKATGCLRCRKTGYKGRKGIFEIITVNKELRQAILEKADPEKIENIAEAGGFTDLKKAGLALIRSGETSVEEINRVLNKIE